MVNFEMFVCGRTKFPQKLGPKATEGGGGRV